ncbi:MAG: hypothetical protein IJU41_03645 [Clostridia bacterium]|nr:hypothetical protein [Clostridia bacterium]
MIKIIYADIARGAAEDAQYRAQMQAYADADRLSTGAAPRLIATGETDRWKLDGSVDILSYAPTDYGYISAEQSDSSGDYGAGVGIDILFSSHFASSGLTITFDPTEDVYYTFAVAWYNGETLLREERYTSDAVEYVAEGAVNLYDKICIRFEASSKPYRFARIAHIVFGVGRQFLPSDFTAVTLVQEAHPISAELAIDTSAFTLRPRKNIQYIFQTRQSFKILRGDTVIASHYLKEATLTSQNNYSVSCQSAIGILEEHPFAAHIYFNQTAAAIAADIIGDIFGYTMDAALQSITLSGYIPDGNRRDALHHLLFAIGAVCSTSESESIRIFAPPAAAKQIPNGNIYTGASVKQNPTVTKVRLAYHSYSTSGSGESVEVNGATYYDTVGWVEKVNPDVVAGTPDNPVEIKDATLVTQARATALIDAVYDYYVSNSELTQKIIITNENVGDKVDTEDILGNAFSGVVTKREAAITNLFAATLTVRGANV